MLSDLTRQQQLILLGLVLVILSGLAVMAYRNFSDKGEIIIEEPKPISREEILVHLVGAVNREGVYKLLPGDRLVDLLELAGGTSGLADLSSLNLAVKLNDGQKICVPVLQKKGFVTSELLGDREIGSKKININSATEKELCTISGIGPVTAKRIIAYRQDNGPFYAVEDIMKVDGVGDGKFRKIKDWIRI
ncbi:MAG: ComEA family DNA-binding protein [Candidatus Saganbacteria bacterium]|nr:ComEA family DNA-binding protein [Candidatus Saganbacteria bacterium]